MPMFDVFVEGAVDGAPGAVERLAAAIGAHYGVPADAIAARLAQGRFRVKTRCDQPTASAYLRDLTALGARVSVTESEAAAAGAPAARPSGPYLPTPVPGTMRAAPPATATKRTSGPLPPAQPRTTTPASVLPPAQPRTTTPASVLPPAKPRTTTPASVLPPAVPRTTTPASVLPPATGPKPTTGPLSPLPAADPSRPAASGAFASGLAAAFSGEAPAAELGAIGEGALSLSALDGSEEAAPPVVTFAPPAEALPASIGPAANLGAPPARPSQPPQGPVDLFAPPEAEHDELAVELAPEDAPRAKAAPPVADPAPAAATRAPAPTPVASPVVAVTAPRPPRWRFAAGVLLAVVLGFVPAHAVASIREGSVDREIDDHVIEVQAQVGSPGAAVSYDALDGFRAAQADRKRAGHRDVALLALAIWAASAAGLGYVWFRRLPWRDA